MEKEFKSLSEKMFEVEQFNVEEEFVMAAKEKDIKEFVKIIKKEMKYANTWRARIEIINKRAGDKLI